MKPKTITVTYTFGEHPDGKGRCRVSFDPPLGGEDGWAAAKAATRALRTLRKHFMPLVEDGDD